MHTYQPSLSVVEDYAHFESLLLSQVRNAVIATDLEGRITYWNRFAETLYQWKADDVCGMMIADVIVPPQSRQQVDQILGTIQETGHWEGEFEVRRQDGSTFPAYVANTLYQDEGKVAGMVGISYDITERKQVEDALQQTNRKMLTVWESMTDAFFILDSQWKFTYINSQAQKVLQRTQEELIGTCVWDSFPEAVGSTFDREYHRATKEQISVSFEEFYPPLDMWIEVHAYPSAIGLSVYFRDITERKAAAEQQARVEQALRISEQRLQLMLASGRFGTFQLDLIAGRYLEISDICRAQFALPAEGDVFMADFFERVHPDDRAALQAAVDNAAAAGETDFVSDYRIILPNRNVRWITVNGTLTYDEAGRPILMLGVTQDTTERKRAENELLAAEQEQRELAVHLKAERTRLIESQAIAKVGSWEIDYKTETLIWSDETYRIFETNRDKFDGSYTAVMDRLLPDDRVALRKVYQQSLADRTSFETDYRVRMDDGSIKHVHQRCQTFYNAEGKPTRSFGTVQDITAIKEAEQERDRIEASLRQSETRYRSVVETIESLVIIDQEGRLIDVNQNACESLGYTREELLQLRVQDYELKVQPERLAKQWKQLAAGEIHTLIDEGVQQRKDGSTFPVEVRVGLLESEGPGMMVAVARDITERKQAEENLALRDKAIHASSNGILLVDARHPEMPIVSVNPAFEQMTGYTASEVLGKNCRFLQGSEQDQPTLNAIRDALKNGIAGGGILRNYRKDGTHFWNELSLSPIYDAEGTLTHFVGIQNDVTERIMAEERLHRSRVELEAAQVDLENRVQERTCQLQQAKDDAERANTAKSDFLSRMSHELRTPLNSILGFAQLMELDEPDNKQAVRLSHIIKSGQQLLQMINEVLDLARVESGRLQLSSEPVCLTTCVQNAVDMIQPLCQQRDQVLIFNDSECDLFYVHADQQRLSQVLINLLSNATKYNPVGGVILVQCENASEGQHRVSINDSGIGISEEKIARLFQPFERLDADGTKVEGTGLGLAVSKQLMDLMNGTIRVKSVIGSGSTFTIELPSAEAPASEALRHEIETLSSPSVLQDSLETPDTILYIEDNPMNWNVMEQILGPHPAYDLKSAQTGLSGLALARAALPSLILLDLHLPDMPGNEVLHLLQSDPITREIPVVIVSADATLSQIQPLLAAGAVNYVTKPLDVRQFLEMVQKIVHAKD